MTLPKYKLKVLFFTLNDPIFGKGGQHLRTRAALQILSNFSSIVLITGSYKAQIDIDLIDDFKSKIKKMPIEKNEPSKEITPWILFRRIIHKIGKILQVAAFFEVINYLFLETQYKRRLSYELSKQHFDIAWLDDDDFLGTYIQFLRKKGLRVFYNTHNIRSQLNYMMRSYSGMNEWKRKILYFLEILHEKYFFGKADMLFYCNENEKTYYENIMRYNKASFLPNVSVCEGMSKKPLSLPDKYVVWAGTMTVDFHRESLLFLLRNVWPSVAAMWKDLHFVVVGKTNNKSVELLRRECKNLKRVIIIKNPDEIEGYIQNAIALLSFYIFGGGTRIKILDAMHLGTPVIANDKEIEDFSHIDKKSVLIANNAEEFTQKIGILLGDNKVRDAIIKKGKELIRTHYTNNALLPVVKKAINSTLK